MNKFKKLVLVFITAAGIACLAGAAACSKGPKYYQLTFEGAGIDYVLQDKLAEFESGGTVKSGLEVKFKVSLGSNSSGTPAISLNGEPLTADAEGVYSFVITEDSVVSVSGLQVSRTVVLDKMQKIVDADGNAATSETKITYLDEDGNDLGGQAKVLDGGDFKFKLKVSPYYIREKQDGTPAYTVSCNTEELVPDSNGFYTAKSITDDVTVSISGLEQEPGFTERGDGTGTAEDPYRIRRPIDLFYVAALINNDFYSATFFDKCYKVENPIDMEGEQLYVIGDNSQSNALFSGVFDGNNQRISNFYITDEVIDQATFEKAYLPYVGLFGAAVATTEKPVVIKNVVLDDYEIRVHPAQAANFSYAGSLVGFGIGAQVSGCGLSGEITAVGDDNQMIYLGGVAGLLQSAYNTGNDLASFDSCVTNTATDVEISGVGSPHSAGGVVGYLVSADTSAISYVANCSAYGNVTGAMHAGGVVGTMGRYSSVANCYASGEIIASNGIVNPLVDNEYKVAYAGGIAGYAANDTVISNCYAANADGLYAESLNGAEYQNTGDFLGESAPKEYDAIDGLAAVLFNNLKKADGHTADTFKSELGWLDGEWSFEDRPLAKTAAAGRTINLQIKNGATDVEEGGKNVPARLAPLTTWYKDGNVPEFVSSNDGRSWGYFFDEALTMKAPYSFVPTAANTVLYAGYSDYASIAGKYYLSSDEYSGKAYIELTADGKALFREGGMRYEGTYTYDEANEKIWLPKSCIGALLYTVEELDDGYCAVRGDKTADGFTFTGNMSVLDLANSTAENPSYVVENISLKGKAALDNFVYGEYVGTNGRTYIFNEDGSGTDVNGDRREAFTFTVENGKAVMSFGVGSMEAALTEGLVTTVNGDAVRLKNAFAGVWQRTANSAVKFDFDGVETVTYINGSQKTEAAYSVAGGVATFTVGGTAYEAHFDDGVLLIDNQKYYLDDGYTGVWYASADGERIELSLEGVGKYGYGDAVISYAGGKVADVDAQYSVTDGLLLVYVGDMLYGELNLADSGTRASGSFYSLQEEGYRVDAQFDIYDNFKGNWIAAADDFSAVTFNGKASTSKGEAVITPASGTPVRGTYTLNDGTNGELTVGTKIYDIAFDELNEEVTFTLKDDGAQTDLARNDGWQNVALYDGETEYRFDGKGYIGGKVTVTGGQELDYTVDANGVITLDGVILEATDGGFNYGAAKLSFNAGFGGEWIMSGAKKKLTLGEVDGDLTASVVISDIDGSHAENKTAVYDRTSGALTITERIDGVKVVTKLTLLSANELSYDLTSGSTDEYKVCIKSSMIDAWQGTYAGENSSWTFDGLGSSVYGSGTATYTDNGGSTQYRYKVNSLGMLYIRYSGGVVFVPAKEGEAGFVKDGQTTAYDIVVADAFYELTAIQTGDDEVTFLFDGVGTLYKKEGDAYVKAYTYEVNSDGTLKLVDGNEKTYVGTVTKQGRINYLKIEEATV